MTLDLRDMSDIFKKRFLAMLKRERNDVLNEADGVHEIEGRSDNEDHLRSYADILGDLIEQMNMKEESKTDNDPTVKEVIDSMSDYQKMAFYHCIDYIMKAKIAYKTLDENQKKVCDYMVGYVLKEKTNA